MFKHISLAIILLLTKSTLFGQTNSEDYYVYANIINAEIKDGTKSIAIIKNTIDNSEKNENTFLIAEQLASDNLSDKYQVYNWTENNKKERPSIIDSYYDQLLIDYSKSSIDKFTLTNSFNQAYKTVLIKKSPIRQKSIEQDWNFFYKQYPNSGGIFSFSKIKYYSEKTTAVVYYWVRRNGLNGHGALVVLTKNDKWETKYKIHLWHN